jgi:hypothetical protein
LPPEAGVREERSVEREIRQAGPSRYLQPAQRLCRFSSFSFFFRVVTALPLGL